MARKTSMFTRIIVMTMFVSFLVCLCSSTDTITFNHTLKDGDLLISNNKSYALGFFTPGNSTSSKRYVGIWFQKLPERTAVWVANRDNPVNGTSGILFIDSTGNLVIQDKKTNVSVWNTSLSFPATGIKTYSVQLQETGNLVLYHDHQDRRETPWQSFDYPTDTFLPYMKFRGDKKTGRSQFLSAWKSADDPGRGEYVVGLDLKGIPQAIMYKASSPVWRLGPWNGVRWSGIPEMTPNINSYYYSDNDDKVTMWYERRDASIHSVVMVNESGVFSKIIWQEGNDGVMRWVGMWYFPNDDCDRYGHCGAFGVCDPFTPGKIACKCLPGFKPKSRRDWRQGCWRNETEVCHNGEGFLKLENKKIPSTEMAEVNREIGLEECEELCLKNCSCLAYASSNISDGGSGCITWYGELIDMREFTTGGQDIYVRVSASDLGQLLKKSKEHHGKRLIVSVILPIAAVILVLYCLISTNIRKGKTPPNINTSLQWGEYLEEAGHADVLAFDLNTIRAATNNFSADNKLGEGGFGSVYKGMLQNGQFVAIKTLSRTSQQGIEEFKNEVKLIAKLQHRNLVRLLGCCIQQGEKMLVYEYLPNKALDSFIFDNRQGKLLEWKKRFEIILGTAQGLLYLHQDSRLRIVHRDLKASNVLLDDSMNPKISDFGMARLFEEEQAEANTNRVVGTYGYMSPEYAMGGNFSVKSDVYSFGVLLLEIVSGKKNKHKYKETSLNLIGDVWDFWNEERALEIVDPLLGESYDDQEVLRCIHVGLLCVQLYPNDRPAMSEVIFMLSNGIELSRPNRPGFVLNQGNNAAPLSYSISDGGNQSSSSMSITELVGR